MDGLLLLSQYLNGCVEEFQRCKVLVEKFLLFLNEMAILLVILQRFLEKFDMAGQLRVFLLIISHYCHEGVLLNGLKMMSIINLVFVAAIILFQMFEGLYQLFLQSFRQLLTSQLVLLD